MQTRFDFEHELETDRDGAAVGVGVYSQPTSFLGHGNSGFDIVGNLRLVPKFCEKDPESFFVFFESIADACNWPDVARALMLQTVLIGKA